MTQTIPNFLNSIDKRSFHPVENKNSDKQQDDGEDGCV
jgi:hypothetical protein